MLLQESFGGYGHEIQHPFPGASAPVCTKKTTTKKNQEAESSHRTLEWLLHAVSPQWKAERRASDLCVMVCVSRWCVGRWRRVGFDPPALHVRDELVGDLC